MVSRFSRDDRGTLAVYFVLLTPLLLLLSGLVLDGGGALAARASAANQAEQAARAGANAIDVQVLRDEGRRVVNEDLMRQQVAKFAQGSPDTYGTPTLQNNTVTVTVTVKYKSKILGQDFTMKGKASASPLTDPGP